MIPIRAAARRPPRDTAWSGACHAARGEAFIASTSSAGCAVQAGGRLVEEHEVGSPIRPAAMSDAGDAAEVGPERHRRPPRGRSARASRPRGGGRCGGRGPVGDRSSRGSRGRSASRRALVRAGGDPPPWFAALMDDVVARDPRPPTAGSSSVARIRTVVVLPGLFGPRSANTWPAGTIRSTPSRTRCSPNRCTSPPPRLRSHTSRVSPRSR